MSKHNFLLLFLLSLLLQNCKSDAAKEQPTTTDAPAAVAEAIVEVYAINRQNFRLRDKPNMVTAKQIGLVSYGDFLLYLDEKTMERTTVQLGMRTYDEPFYKVKDLGSDSTEGWIHGSALVRIFRGGKSAYPNFDLLTPFGKYLGELPLKKLESSQKALEFAQKSLASASPATADALYILLEDFLQRNEQEGNFYDMVEGKFEPTRKEWEAIYAGKFDMSTTPTTKKFAAAGYRLNTAEGMLFPTIDYQKMEAIFSAKSTAAMQRYLKLQVEEDVSRTTSDASIVLPLKELADRAIDWEKFGKENPNFPVKAAFTDASWKCFLLVCGSDNSAVYDWESKKVTKEVLDNWAYILTTYPDSDLAQIVKGRQAGIAAEGGLVTEKAQEFCGKMAREIW